MTLKEISIGPELSSPPWFQNPGGEHQRGGGQREILVSKIGWCIGCSLVDPWVKSWQGQSTIGWLKILLVDIQNPGPQTQGSNREREDLLDLVLFCTCFLMSWTSFHKHNRANWINVTIHVGNILFLKYIPHIWQCIGFNWVLSLSHPRIFEDQGSGYSLWVS